MSKALHYIVGASLGTGSDPTGLAILEQEIWKDGHWQPAQKGLALRHLERLAVGDGFPDIVDRIVALIARPEIADSECSEATDIVLDVTGSGRSPVKLFAGPGLAPIIVTITGALAGEQESAPDDWRVPKRELVSNLQVLYQSDRLKMARGLDLTESLVEELEAFKLRPATVASNDPEAWRERQHDDLVFAVAVAAWRASRHVPTPGFIDAHWNKKIEEHHAAFAKTIV